MAASETVPSQTVPDDIARAVILPASYGDLDGVVLPACAWLRQNAPLARAELPGYDPVWVVSRLADVKAIHRDAEVFHNADVNIMLQPQVGDEYLRNILGGHTKVLDANVNYMEPPMHALHRSTISRDFLPTRVGKFESRLRELAKIAVDQLMEHGEECDFVATVAQRYPLNAILELLGVPPEDYDLMLKLTQDTFGGDDPDWKRDDVPATPEAMARQWHAAVEDAYAYFEVLRKDRHAHPRDDLATAIVTATFENGDPVPERFQNHMCLAVALAGHDTTNSAISAGIHGLAQFPDQLERVRADPALVPGLVEESLRWGSPARHYMRNAAADATVSGVEIKDGDRIMSLLISANRDEDAFVDPQRFDVSRRPNPHVAFSFGPHICLGQHIAKLEMRVLFEELVTRLRSIELTAEPTYKISNFVSGFKKLPIRFTKA